MDTCWVEDAACVYLAKWNLWYGVKKKKRKKVSRLETNSSIIHRQLECDANYPKAATYEPRLTMEERYHLPCSAARVATPVSATMKLRKHPSAKNIEQAMRYYRRDL